MASFVACRFPSMIIIRFNLIFVPNEFYNLIFFYHNNFTENNANIFSPFFFSQFDSLSLLRRHIHQLFTNVSSSYEICCCFVIVWYILSQIINDNNNCFMQKDNVGFICPTIGYGFWCIVHNMNNVFCYQFTCFGQRQIFGRKFIFHFERFNSFFFQPKNDDV